MEINKECDTVDEVEKFTVMSEKFLGYTISMNESCDCIVFMDDNFFKIGQIDMEIEMAQGVEYLDKITFNDYTKENDNG